MTVKAFAHQISRKSLAVLTGVVLVLGAAPGLFAQDSTAAIAGVILDPAGKPAFGFKVIVTDVATNTQYMSAPTDAAGNYTIKVPVGGRYKLEGVVADDGVSKLAVQDVAPVSVLEAGTTHLNVRFTNTPMPPIAGATAAATEEEKKKDKGAVPWYKRPGPIVGMVLGSVALAGILVAASGGDDDNNASPSEP